MLGELFLKHFLDMAVFGSRPEGLKQKVGVVVGPYCIDHLYVTLSRVLVELVSHQLGPEELLHSFLFADPLVPLLDGQLRQ